MLALAGIVGDSMIPAAHSLTIAARTTASLSLEFALILAEAACECFLDARRGSVDVTVCDRSVAA